MTLSDYQQAVATLRAQFGEDFAGLVLATDDPTEARLFIAAADALGLAAELLGVAAAYRAPLKEIELGV